MTIRRRLGGAVGQHLAAVHRRRPVEPERSFVVAPGLGVDSLRLQCAMVDPLVAAVRRERLVRAVRPGLPPPEDGFPAVPFPGLFPEVLVLDPPHRQENVRVWVRSVFVVPRDVGHHSAVDELPPHVVPNQVAARIAGQLAGNGDPDLSSDLGILAPLGAFDAVPQRLAAESPGGGAGRREDLRRVDATAAAVIVHLAGPLLGQLLAGPIGGCGDGRVTLGPLHDARVHVADRHSVDPFLILAPHPPVFQGDV